MSEKGLTGKPFTRCRSPKTWMIWVKLNCLKSSGELETIPPLTQRLKSSPGSSILYEVRVAKSSCREQWSMRPIKPRKDTLSHPDNVIHDCTAGSPKGREPYGDGDSIVVGGVTSTQAVGKANHRAKGVRNFSLKKLEVCAMQKAEQILQAMRKLGEKRYPTHASISMSVQRGFVSCCV